MVGWLQVPGSSPLTVQHGLSQPVSAICVENLEWLQWRTVGLNTFSSVAHLEGAIIYPTHSHFPMGKIYLCDKALENVVGAGAATINTTDEAA